MAEEKIVVEQDGFINYLILNNPGALNAIDLQMQEDLLRRLLAAAKDPAVRVIVLKGTGRAFSSGGDIDVMRRSLEEEDVYQVMKNWIQRMHFMEMQIRTIRKPVVAGVQGVCSGSGFNLALACDLVIAADNARFSQSFIRLGLAPDGTYFLPRIVGVFKANEMMMLGEEIDSLEALRHGIVNRVVPLEQLDEETASLARRLGCGPTEALAHIKELVNRSFYQPLDQHLQQECESIARTARSEDFREGVMAFLEKRDPKFGGR